MVHLVNYDVDLAKDEIREQPAFTVNLPRSSLPEGKYRAELFTCEMEPAESVPARTTEEAISCAIPRLGPSATLVITVD